MRASAGSATAGLAIGWCVVGDRWAERQARLAWLRWWRCHPWKPVGRNPHPRAVFRLARALLGFVGADRPPPGVVVAMDPTLAPLRKVRRKYNAISDPVPFGVMAKQRHLARHEAQMRRIGVTL